MCASLGLSQERLRSQVFWGGRCRPFLLSSQGKQKHQAHTCADGGISDIECWKSELGAAAATNQIEIQKIDHTMIEAQSVHQISNNPAKDQPQGNLAAERMGIEVMAAEEEHKEGN